MIDQQKFAGLVRSIYAAGLDFPRWSTALEEIADALGAATSGISGHGERPGESWGMMSRVDPRCTQEYVTHYHSVNPIWSRVPDTPVGTVLTDAMVMPKSEFSRTEFYNDFLLPQGVTAMMSSVVRLEGGRQSIISLQRGSEFEADQLALLTRLAPHLALAVDINTRIALESLVGRPSLYALDHAGQGAIVTDTVGNILFANVTGQRLIDAGGGLTGRGRGLACRLPADTARLHQLIASCADRTAVPRGGKLRVQQAPGEGCLDILVAPLHSDVPWLPVERPVSLILIDPPMPARGLTTESLMEKFGLTRAESIVAIEICSGLGVKSTAARLGVAQSTVRSQLANVFEKTGARKQAELVRILLHKSAAG